MAEYWTKVGEEIRRHGRSPLFAGGDTPFYRYKAERCGALFDELTLSGRTVLEVGCGPGAYLTRSAQQRPGRLVGCDVSPSMLGLAHRHVAGRVPLAQVDGYRLPFRDGAFEISFTVTVLEHNDDDLSRVLLAEMARVTLEGIILFEDAASPQRRRPGGRPAVRPAVRYAEALAQSGFALQDSRRLAVSVSEPACQLAGRLLRGRRHGVAVARSVAAAERAILPASRFLDRLVPASGGLCRMTFTRPA